MRYRTRFADTSGDLEAAFLLRCRAFRSGGPVHHSLRDEDAFDARCRHVLVEDTADGRLVATFRLMVLRSGAEVEKSYSAQHYELSGLKDYSKPMIELGRFCVAPEHSDPDVLRAAWGMLARFVDDTKSALLFGCSSFQGTDARVYADTFAMLRQEHIAPRHWRPRIKAERVFRFAQKLRRKPDRRKAMRTMPPLLRSYLSMGGWVSDHAVVDTDLNTLHVFTGLEVSAIPPARAKVLRAVMGQA